MAKSKKSKQSAGTRPRQHMKLGQVLLEEKVIGKKDLRKALARQRKNKLSLGHTLVEMGITTEADIVGAFNHRYGSSLTSLDDDLDNYLRTRGLKSDEKRFGFRLSIKTKLSIGVIFIIWITILTLSFVILGRQREQLYDQTVKMGKVSLNYIANNARIPLLNDSVLQLNTLVKETSSIEGVEYALIIDRKGRVQAHTDPTKIRRKREKFSRKTPLVKEGKISHFSYFTPEEEEILELATKITFRKKNLGSVSVGVSLDFINEQILRETIYVVLLSLLVIILGVMVSLFMGANFSRPIYDLVLATQEIGLGNLRFKIKKIRNDELGDLASAFNFMSGELLKKALMQESFGKYVGSEVLDMIMADPENAWLKGRLSNASVLFTDIRGFTAYSEGRKPEAVVEALNEYFDIATRHIQEEGGYVDKFIGDAVMGVFGVPIHSKDHAEKAVRAALAMQVEFAEAGKKNKKGVLNQVGIGINAGPVVSGNIGSQDKIEYTVIGDSVNVASRINGLAGSGETVISQSVLDAAGNGLKVHALPPQKVKGKSEALKVYKVMGFKTGENKSGKGKTKS